MTLRPKATIDEIREALTPVLQKGGASRAIVFGSHASGEADDHSDLDIVIVAETTHTFFDRYKDFDDIYELWRGGLDMLIYTPGELAEMVEEGRAFIERVLDTGVVIYEK
ncbi:MAG: nucleotidyltransferase domain-containing protein [Chloroflexi bacterium]|nr:nucleotidyltransferase domain-containing protein [Chloroflexota bacterium]